MAQAIVTKYIPPTNTRCSRIKASAWVGSVTISWDYSLDVEENHLAAAKALADKYSWRGNFVGGGSPDEKGYCFVQEQDYYKFTVFGRE